MQQLSQGIYPKQIRRKCHKLNSSNLIEDWGSMQKSIFILNKKRIEGSSGWRMFEYFSKRSYSSCMRRGSAGNKKVPRTKVLTYWIFIWVIDRSNRECYLNICHQTKWKISYLYSQLIARQRYGFSKQQWNWSLWRSTCTNCWTA